MRATKHDYCTQDDSKTRPDGMPKDHRPCRATRYGAMGAVVAACAATSNGAIAEDLMDAKRRSGQVVTETTMPAIVKAGHNYEVTWVTQTYLDLEGSLVLYMPDGSRRQESASIISTKRGPNSIGGDSNQLIKYRARFDVPQGQEGDIHFGFYQYVADEQPLKLFAVFRQGVWHETNSSAKLGRVPICQQDA